MSKYPLCKKAGLYVYSSEHVDGAIEAVDVEAYLASQKQEKDDTSATRSPDMSQKRENNNTLSPPWKFTAEDFGFGVKSGAVNIGYALERFNAKLAKLLEAAPVVHYGERAHPTKGDGAMSKYWTEYEPERDGTLTNYTHTARLVCIEPIAKESAKDVLRDLIALIDKEIPKNYFSKYTDAKIIDRARAIFKGKE